MWVLGGLHVSTVDCAYLFSRATRLQVPGPRRAGDGAVTAPTQMKETSTVNCKTAGFAPAFPAAARPLAPDVWFLVRHLLGAGVRIGAVALTGRRSHTFATPSAPAAQDEGGRR